MSRTKTEMFGVTQLQLPQPALKIAGHVPVVLHDPDLGMSVQVGDLVIQISNYTPPAHTGHGPVPDVTVMMFSRKDYKTLQNLHFRVNPSTARS